MSCCTPCLIGQDKFAANDGKPHAGWTLRNAIRGTAAADEATNVGGVYHFPAAGVSKFNTAHPDGVTGKFHVQAKLLLTESASLYITTTQVVQTIPVVVATTTQGSPGINEVQLVHQSYSQTANWRLEFNGQTTVAMEPFLNPTEVQSALEALSTIGAGNVSVTFTNTGTEILYTITFIGTLAYTNVVQMTTDAGPSTWVETQTQGSSTTVNEVQTVTLGPPSPTGGTFTLAFSGQTTGTIAYNASAATVQTALEALSNIGSGNVAVTGSAGGTWTVTFQGTLAATNVAQMTGNGSLLTINEKQRVQIVGASGGSFTLTFSGQTTGNIAYNASAATVQTALEALSNIAPGDVTVTLNATSDWTVEFTGVYRGVDVSLMIGDKTNLTASGGTGAQADVFVGYLSDTKFLFARVNYHTSAGTCDYLELYKRDGGADTLLTLPDGSSAKIPIRGLTLDQWHTIDVCLVPDTYGSSGSSSYGDTLRAHVTLADGTHWAVQAIAESFTGGAYVGLGSGLGSVDFDDFRFNYFRGTSHLSCPNCNGPCAIFSDTFTYADSADNALGCFWTTKTGTARFKTNQLEIVASSKVKCLLPHPTNKSSKIVPVSLKWEAGIIARVDLGSGYAQFDSTNRRIFLRDNAGNLLDSTAVNSLPVADNALYTVEVCLGDKGTRARLTATAFGVCLEADTNDTGDPFVYLASDGGTVHFDNFAFSKHKDSSEPKDGGCPRCDCPETPIPCTDCCTEPAAAGQYVVDLGGGGWTSMMCRGHLPTPDHPTPGDCAVNPIGTCPACEQVLGEYLVEANGACSWVYIQEFFCVYKPDGTYWWVRECCSGLLTPANPAFTFSVHLSLVKDGPGGTCRWKVEVTIGVDVNIPQEDCGQCLAGVEVTVGGAATNRVIYYSGYIPLNTACLTLPVRLTKDSEVGAYPCRGALPTTITANAA